MKIETFKAILWNIPFIGIIYLTVAVVHREYWINGNSRIISGLLIQLLSMVLLTILIASLLTN